MLFLIEKSNWSGRWTGRQWWVEADTVEQAIALGRRNWPSQNTTDQFHARPLTQEEFDEHHRSEAEHAMRRAGSASTSTRRADRVAAYLDRCRENKLNSLNRNVQVLGQVTPSLERIAEKIDEDCREQIGKLYR
jgi:hypothetical protein